MSGRLIALWTLALFAAAGCGASSTGNAGSSGSSTTSTPRGSVTCSAAVDAAVEFFDGHPDGPAELGDAGRAELARLTGEVEAVCEAQVLAEFGPAHLEPWAVNSGGAIADRPDVTTTVP